MRVSIAVAFRAKPPQPQIPMIPIFSLLTKGWIPNQSTAAEKSSVLISGDGTLRGVPELSPVYEPSKAMVTKPRSANV